MKGEDQKIPREEEDQCEKEIPSRSGREGFRNCRKLIFWVGGQAGNERREKEKPKAEKNGKKRQRKRWLTKKKNEAFLKHKNFKSIAKREANQKHTQFYKVVNEINELSPKLFISYGNCTVFRIAGVLSQIPPSTTLKWALGTFTM
jgi:hypothetical protein